MAIDIVCCVDAKVKFSTACKPLNIVQECTSLDNE